MSGKMPQNFGMQYGLLLIIQVESVILGLDAYLE